MLALFLSLGFVGTAGAVTIPDYGVEVQSSAQGSGSVSVPGYNVEVQKSTQAGSNVNVEGPAGTSVNVNKSTDGSATVKTPGNTTTVAPGSVKNTSAGGGTVNVTKTGNTVNVEVGNQKVQVRSENDLKAYKEMVLENCSNLTEINTEGNTVEVKYNQPARFFGIFKNNLGARITVNAEGKAKVKLPWYSFLFTKNTAEIETQIQTELDGRENVTVSLQDKALTLNLINSKLSVNTAPCVTVTTKTESTNTTSTQTAPTPKPTTTTKTNTNASVTVTVTLDSFKGEWNGYYTPSPLTDDACKPGGNVSLNLNSNGVISGYAVVQGEKAFGGGTTDVNGNINGSWDFSGTLLSFKGKLDSKTNQGSGSYQNQYGCFGTFTVSR